jgi:predicted Zn finger-like uncharacterized protein
MIIVCPNCSARLQIDEEKAPARPFSVRCPKCANSISSSSVSPASEQSALAVGDSPSTERRRFDYTRSAPAFELESENGQPAQAQPAPDDAVKLLLQLLRQSSPNAKADDLPFNGWNRRKVLVCAAEMYREQIAKSLAENNYQVFVAEETRQAIETMRSNQLQVVILEGQFDQAEQGAAFVVREINVMRAAQRRRLFFVLLSTSHRTMDAHAAFLNNVNAVVNVVDLEELPRILEIALREYNELYKDYNAALSLPAL